MPSDVKDTYRVIEVEAGKTASEAVFNNPAVYGKFIFKKVDQNGKLITGTDVKFKLYRQAADGQSWEQAGGEITAPKTGTGIYESGFLPAGNYKPVSYTHLGAEKDPSFPQRPGAAEADGLSDGGDGA